MIKKCLIALGFFLVFLSNIMAAELRPYKVYLKPGTVLTNLKNKVDYRIPRGIYAFVLETNPLRRDHFIVYDKNGMPAYETTALGLVEIEKDIAILPDVDAEIIYPEPSVFKSNNKHAFFDTQFNIHFDNLDASAFNSLYETEYSSSLASRFELRTLFTSQLPVNVGFSINYETASWSSEENSLQLTALSFGPHIQHYIYEKEDVAVSILLGAEYAPTYQTKSSEFTDKYHAVLIDIGAEILWGTSFGKWSAGAHFRRHDLSLTSSTRTNFNPIPEDLTVMSIGAMLGYKYEWDL
jgi:hypothetical protein